MKKMAYILRDVFKLKGNITIKLISLTLGLTVGVLLFTYNAFELSYDDFQANGEQIYRVGFQWKRNDKEAKQSPVSYAPVSSCMVADMPEVECGTCVFDSGMEEGFRVAENIFRFRTIYADTSFFRLFSYPVLSGVPSEELQQSGRVFLSEKFVRKVFGNADPVGKTIESEGYEWVIAGVFKDLPENTHLRFDAVKSLESARGILFMDWGGGDAFYNYVRLSKGNTVGDVEARFPEMIREYMGTSYEECWFSVHLQPLRELYTKYEDKDVMSKILLLSLLAIVVLIVSALNYVLISISSLAVKARSIGIYKVNGATRGDIFRLFAAEAGVILALALILTAVILLASNRMIESQMHVTLRALFSWYNLWVVGIVVFVLFILAGIIPAKIFSSVSVMQVFRQVTGGRKVWKRVLLGTQFSMAVFLITLLIIFGGQYNRLVNKDLGYNTKGLYCTGIQNTAGQAEAAKVKTELKRLSCVRGVTISTILPFSYLSGNAISLGDNREAGFSTRWMQVDEDFLDVLEIPVIQGSNVKEAFVSKHGAIVNQNFLDRVKLDINGTFTSDAGETVLRSVCRDFRVGSLYTPQAPVMMEGLDMSDLMRYTSLLAVTVKLDPVTGENLAAVHKCISEAVPGQQPQLLAYSDQIRSNYTEVEYMRNMVMLVGMLALFITILGLIGFVGDEIARRTKEIAIRKVNGATVKDVLSLLWEETGWLALIAMPAGLGVAYWLGWKWLEQFAEKLPLSWWLFGLGTVVTMCVIWLTVTMRTYRAAVANPVKSLKTE